MIGRLLLLALLLPLHPLFAQGFDMAQGTAEVQISADDGLEWQSEASRVVAKGNAKAVRGDVTVTADTLTAYYRSGGTNPSAGGGNQIWRVDADGHVTITNPSDTATGTKAIYDMDKAVLILKGSPAKLVTPTESFTADDALEYWENERMAVLRGNGVATGKDKKIQADVLTAHFKDNKQSKKTPKPSGSGTGGGGMELSRSDAFGHVILTTAKDKITGDKGDYNADTGIATMTGTVTLTREGNVMNGGFAHVDMNSGISTLYGNSAGDTSAKKRVQAVFTPTQKAAKTAPPSMSETPQ